MSNAQSTTIYTEDLGLNESETRGEGREARDVLTADITYRSKRGYYLNVFIVTVGQGMSMRSFAVYQANPLDLLQDLAPAGRFNAKTLAKLAAIHGAPSPVLTSLVERVRANYHAKKAADAAKRAERVG